MIVRRTRQASGAAVTARSIVARWTHPVMGTGVPPFFFLAGLWGCLAPIVWVAMFTGSIRAPRLAHAFRVARP